LNESFFGFTTAAEEVVADAVVAEDFAAAESPEETADALAVDFCVGFLLSTGSMGALTRSQSL
jgi:hypothetical protein